MAKSSLFKTVTTIVAASLLTLSVAAGAVIGKALQKPNESQQPGSGAGQGQGEVVRSVSKIEKTNTYGLIDEYTITYTDGTTSIFIVTNGKDGEPGVQGFPGVDGHTPTITIDENGHWVIDGVTTSFDAVGPQGPQGPQGPAGQDGLTPYIGVNGNWWIGETDTGVKAQGQNGEDGYIPLIGENGNWWIGGTDTGVPAQGQAGRGIASIDKTDSQGLIDVYTITYTDGTTSTFFVTNGSDGSAQGQGVPGQDGHTPVITIGENGNWFVDGVDTGTKAQGPAGQAGQDGVTPHIGDNGNWWIDDHDTGVPAQGFVGTSVLVGNGQPDDNNGNIGDKYIDLDTGDMYEKTDAGWGTPTGNSGIATPHIGANGNWYIGGTDTGITAQGADGVTPHIGTNGNWWVGETDLGVPAQGAQGPVGPSGTSYSLGTGAPTSTTANQGDTYIDMSTGDLYKMTESGWEKQSENSGFAIPHIGTDGYWYVGENNTGVLAQGPAGQNGNTVLTGNTAPDNNNGVNGDTYIDLTGYNIYVKDNGEWVFKGCLQGSNGQAGRGIVSIERTSGDGTPGTVDTYTITYSDNTTDTFVVANGSNGAQGLPGENGHTPTIEISNDGYWVIDGTKTTVLAQGTQGNSVLVGNGAPNAGEGIVGDTYINLQTGDVYTKTETGWGDPTGDSGFASLSIVNGFWYIGDENTGVQAQGASVLAGNTVPDANEGHIGDTYIDASTGNLYLKTSTGWGDPIGNLKGANGRSIVSIERTSGTGAAGTIDTYTITYSDSTTSTFTVTNGENGNQTYFGSAAPTDANEGAINDSYINVTDWHYYVMTDTGWEDKGSIRGTNGVSIDNIAFESSNGRVDTYTITYDNGTTSTFTVTNGNTVITGTVDPVSQGNDGDSYINTTSWEYFVKENGVWESQGHINGADGADGTSFKVGHGDPNGDDSDPSNPIAATAGINGDSYLDLDTWDVYVSDGADWTWAGNIHNIPTVFHIQFDTDSEGQTENPEAQDVQAGYGVAQPEDPNKTGYYFQGWYTPDGHRWDFEKDTPTKNMTLTAKWATFKVENGILTGCTETGAVVIPSFFDGQVVTGISGTVFKGNTSITSVTIPHTVQNIPDGAFEGCTALTEVYMPEGLQTIGENAFKGCTSMQSVVVPKSVKTIGDHAFADCTQLKYVYLSNTQTRVNSLTNDSRAPQQGLSIGSQAFKNCSSLLAFVIPNNIESIGFGAFEGCSGLKSLSMPSMTYNNGLLYGHGAPAEDLGDIWDWYLDLDTNNMYSKIEDSSWELLPPMIFGYTFYGTGAPDVGLGDEDDSYLDYETGTAYEKKSTGWEIDIYSSVKPTSNLGYLFATDDPSTIPSNLETINITGGDCIYAMMFTTISSIKTVHLADSIRYIETNAFSACTSLQTINLPDRLERIDKQAFYSCTSLSSITIPASVSVIGDQAFNYCSSLSNLEIKDGVSKTIGWLTFADCTSLTTVSIPGCVSLIDEGAFGDCTGLTSVYFLEGNGQTSIGLFAFNGCTNIETLVLSNCVVRIGNNAFDGNKIQSIVIPDSVTYIGELAFNNCSNLAAIYFGNSLEELGWSAFSDTALTNVVLPESLIYIGTEVFAGCDNMVSITMPYAHLRKRSGNEEEQYFSTLFGGYVDVPTTLKTVVITGDNIIPEDAFNGCSNIETVAITGNPSYIGKGALSGCTSLVSLTIPYTGGCGDFSQYAYGDTAPDSSTKSVIYYDTSSGILWLKIDGSWQQVNDIDYSLIGTGQPTVAGYQDAYWLDYLTGTCYEWDDSIGDWDLDGFAIEGSDAVVHLGYLFGADYYDGSQYYDAGLPLSLETVNLLSGTVSEGEYVIDEYAFAGCSTVKTINLPDNIDGFCEGAFLNCSSLINITIPETVTWISNHAFANCLSLKTILIPDSVTGMYSNVFENCTSLEYVVLSDNTSVDTIFNSAFLNCSSLKAFAIPDSVTYICESAFEGCSSLKSMVIPEQVTAIEARAFASCTSLEYFAIPSNIESGLYKDVLVGCTSLKTLVLPNAPLADHNQRIYQGDSSTPAISLDTKDPTDSTNANGQYHFNTRTNDLFVRFADGEWCKIANLTRLGPGTGNLVIITEYSQRPTSATAGEIGDIAYAPLVPLAFVKTSNGWELTHDLRTQYLGSLFGGADNSAVPESLKTVIMNANIQYNYSRTFKGCTHLETVVLSDGTYMISESMFKGCTSLKNLPIGQYLTRIGEYAFKGCTGLTNVIVPNSVVSIGLGAFQDCNNITSMMLPYVGGNNLKTLNYGTSSADIYDNNDSYYYYYRTNTEQLYSKNWSLPKKMELMDVKCYDANTPIPENPSVGDYYFRSASNRELYRFDGRNWVMVGAYSIYAPNKPYLGYIFGASTVADSATSVPVSLTTIIISEGADDLTGDSNGGSFEGCTNLKNVILPNTLRRLGNRTFYGCTGLGSISIPGSASNIGEYVFTNCTSLKSVTLGEGITALGYNMFQGCTSLASFSFPSTLENLGFHAFHGCTSLQSMVIPNTVKSIGTFTFQDCTGLKYVSLPAICATLQSNFFNGCTSLIGVVLPINLHMINTSAFEGCTSLTSITVPDTLYEIGQNAFKGCTKLRAVYNIENSQLTYVRANAFEGCSKLESFDGHSKATDKPNFISYAFKNCTSLKSVSLPSNANIGSNNANSIFEGCTALEYIDIPMTGNSSYTRDIWRYFGTYTSATTEFRQTIANLKTVILRGPTGTSSIEIGANTFKDCTNLETVMLIGNFRYIGNYAFDGCTSLKTVVLPDTMQNIYDYAFRNCSSLETINIPSSLESIGSYCFSGCSSLKEAFIKSDLSVGSYAFQNCASITSVVIPNTFTSVSTNCFEGCTSLAYVAFPTVSTFTSIGGSAFKGCTALENIVVPNNVKYINQSAFQGCSHLVTLSVPFVGYERISSDGYRTALSYIFGENESASDPTSLNKIPSTLRTIVVTGDNYSLDGSSFKGCRYVTTIAIRGTPSNYGLGVLDYCKNLERFEYVLIDDTYQSMTSLIYAVSVPASLKTIVVTGNGVIKNDQFNSLSGVQEIIIDGTPSSIGDNAFKNCSSLTSIVIPSSVTSIGESAFDHCTSLKSVYLGSSLETIEAYAFQDCSSLESIVIPNSVTLLKYGAFMGCSSLKYATLSNNLDEIDDDVFNGCSSLESIVIPDSVKVIDSLTFNECASLKYIYFGAQVEEINDSFVGCTSLTSIVVPNTVTKLGGRAFKDCTSLKTAVIPNSVEYMHGEVFSGCISLETIVIPSLATYGQGWGTLENPIDVDPDDSVENEFYINKITGDFWANIGGNWVKLYNVKNGTNAVHYGSDEPEDSLGSVGDTYVKHGLELWIKESTGWKLYLNMSYYSLAFLFDDYGDISAVPASLKSVTITRGNECSEYYYSFTGYSNLETVVLPTNMTAIGVYAFYQCSSLKSIDIPDEVIKIKENAFAECSDLAYANISPTTKLREIGEYAFFYSGLKGIAVMNHYDSVLIIKDYAFMGCSGLTDVWIVGANDLVVDAKQGAFADCSSLKRVNASFSSIGDYAFERCGVEYFYFDQYITYLGDGTFNGCTNLKMIDFSQASTLYAIGEETFRNCFSLNSVIFEHGGNESVLTTIGDDAFMFCTGLTAIKLPSHLETIGKQAFYYCSALRTVYIPQSATEVGKGAFQFCYAMESITIPFVGGSKNGTNDQIFVWIFGLDAYNSHSLLEFMPTALQKVTITGGNGSENIIPANAFHSFKYIESIVIEGNVTAIGDYAFKDCSSLKSIVIPGSVTTIETHAFEGCSQLTQVYYGNTTSNWGSITGGGKPTGIMLKSTDGYTTA